MSLTDSQRRRLHADLERTLGPESAEAMMELLPPVGWADVARQSSLDALAAELRGEMALLRAEFKVLEGRVESEIRRMTAINAVTVVATSMTTAAFVLAAAHFA